MKLIIDFGPEQSDESEWTDGSESDWTDNTNVDSIYDESDDADDADDSDDADDADDADDEINIEIIADIKNIYNSGGDGSSDSSIIKHVRINKKIVKLIIIAIVTFVNWVANGMKILKHLSRAVSVWYISYSFIYITMILGSSLVNNIFFFCFIILLTIFGYYNTKMTHIMHGIVIITCPLMIYLNKI